MNRQEAKDKPRKPYESPVLRAISLKAEEVLALGCKLATGGPPPRGRGCRFGGCRQAGS